MKQNHYKRLIYFYILLLIANPVLALNYFVSGSGSDSNNGLTYNSPYLTIQIAANHSNPGDTVFVMNGTYTNSCSQCNVVTITRSGNASSWIVYINYPGHSPILQFNGWQGFSITSGAAYIEINGFTIRGNNANVTLANALNQPASCNNPTGSPDPQYNGNGISSDGRSGGHPHHLRIKNNTVYECGGAGISTIQSDYTTIENNIIFNNCWYTIYGTSGISTWQNWNFDNSSGYRMFIKNNRCFGNRLYVPWSGPCQITDGNGIIIDDSKNTQNGSTLGAYAGRTLVTNNIVYGNGGSGIHAYSSEHVDIINNTAYLNSQSTEIDNGEIFGNSANDITILNNILYALSGNKINSNYNNINLTYDYNIHYGGTTASLIGLHTIYGDPELVAPSLTSTADFHLQQGSPAIDNGTSNLAPSVDFSYYKRPIGLGYDMGAYEWGNIPVLSTVSSQASQNAVSVFYQKSSEIIVIRIAQGEIKDVVIYDETGKVSLSVKEYNTAFAEINASGFLSGLYIVKISTDTGMYAAKIVKW
jgi:parallel beta-helix repeat protein